MKLSMKIAACENNKSKYTHTDYYNLRQKLIFKTISVNDCTTFTRSNK